MRVEITQLLLYMYMWRWNDESFSFFWWLHVVRTYLANVLTRCSSPPQGKSSRWIIDLTCGGQEHWIIDLPWGATYSFYTCRDIILYPRTISKPDTLKYSLNSAHFFDQVQTEWPCLCCWGNTEQSVTNLYIHSAQVYNLYYGHG